MRHVTAVAQLNTGLRAFRMNRVGHLLHIGDDGIIDIQLTIKRHTAQVHRTVRNSRHSYSAASYGYMIVLQFLGRLVRTSHILKSRAADKSIPQCDRSQLEGREQFIIVHLRFMI